MDLIFDTALQDGNTGKTYYEEASLYFLRADGEEAEELVAWWLYIYIYIYMYIYVYMYICIYVCMYIYIYAHTFACRHVRANNVHICIYIHIYIYIHTHVCVCVRCF